MGCYSINVFDTNDDGMSCFANNSGNGSIRIKNLGGSTTKIFEPDFGDGFKYSFSIPTVVGINEIDLSESISVYPNPATSVITLETTGLIQSNWDIFDGIGRKVTSGTTPNDHHAKDQINVENYSAGIYYLHLTNGGKTMVKKFMINR
mgnify:FL=1